MPRRKQPTIPDALLDQLLDGADPKSAFDPDGVLDALKKALAERMLNAEMDQHLCGEAADGRSNSRNGYGQKTVLTETGRLALDIPRDRQGTFDPQLIAKYQRRFPGFDEKIVSLYARGMSVREIQGHLRELYGSDVSPDLVSAVTDAVLDEVAAWQNRPLEAVYPLVFFDAVRVKVRDEGLVRNKAIHIALGVRADGTKEVLGLWVEQNEGAKFWLRAMGAEIPGHRPELAAGLARVDPVLCLPQRGAPDPLRRERHRSPERQAAPGCAGQGPFPHGRGSHQGAVLGVAPGREGMDHAGS